MVKFVDLIFIPLYIHGSQQKQSHQWCLILHITLDLLGVRPFLVNHLLIIQILAE